MKKRPASLLSVLTLVVALAFQATGQSRWTFELCGGLPYNLPSPLTVHQAGEEDISITANFNSEPFVVPVYWDWRIGIWSGQRGWEFEAVHHKIILRDPPAEIGAFRVTHGLNFVTVNRAWLSGKFMLRLGGGIVLAHPETTVRGRTLPENGGIFGWGYYVSGPVLYAAAGKQLPVTEWLFLTADAKVQASYNSVPVAGGNARFLIVVAELTFGLGVNASGAQER